MAKSPDDPVAGSLQCDSCGRRIDCAEAELIKYAQHSWPRCCGRVMRLYCKDPDTGEWKAIGKAKKGK